MTAILLTSIESQSAKTEDSDQDDSDVSEEECDKKFKDFQGVFKRKYNSESDMKLRRQVFRENLKKIKKGNKENKSYTQDVNRFADFTWEEFSTYYLSPKLTEESVKKEIKASSKNGLLGANRRLQSTNPVVNTLPYYVFPSTRNNEGVDWRITPSGRIPYVPPVKNQGGCGSCWAFSTATVVEAAYSIFRSVSLNLSPQHLVDCSRIAPYYNAGCNGGYHGNTYLFFKNVGVVSRSVYPYTGITQTCKTTVVSANVKTRITSYAYVSTVDGPEPIITALKRAPVSVTFCVESSFQFYRSGVYWVGSCGLYANHLMALVGYKLVPSQPYFVIRNSWGTGWGELGDVRVAMTQGKGICSTSMAYSTVSVTV